MAAALYRDPKTKSIEQILKHVNISRATLYSYLRYEDVELGAFANKKKPSDTKMNI